MVATDTIKWTRTTALTATVTSLKNGTEYAFEIQAGNAAGMSATSADVTATPATTPSAPQNLETFQDVDADDELTVTLIWDAPSEDGGADITSYEYRRQGARWLVAGDGTVRTAEVDGLDPSLEYIFEVQAVNAMGAGLVARTDGTTGTGTDPDPDPTPGTTTGGEITEIDIVGAVEKTIDGGKRMHVGEGDFTEVSVTIEWSFAELRALWKDVDEGDKPPDAMWRSTWSLLAAPAAPQLGCRRPSATIPTTTW